VRLPVGEEPSYAHVTATDAGDCTLVLLNDCSAKDATVLYVSCFTAAAARPRNRST
jgi:hypothetical protein